MRVIQTLRSGKPKRPSLRNTSQKEMELRVDHYFDTSTTQNFTIIEVTFKKIKEKCLPGFGER